MARTAVDPKLVELVTKQLADEGKLVEAGWVGYKLMVLPQNAPQIQIDECRLAFFAGAQHLFSSIMNMMDEEEGPTEADQRKMELLHDELTAFGAQFEARTKTKQ